MTNRIYLFANLGDLKKHPFGGGEVGNRRTLCFLKEAGFDIVIIDKFKKVLERNLLKRIWMLILSLWNYIEYCCKLLFARRKNSVVHIVGFYGTIVYFEAALVAAARILGYKVVYEMRGGGADLFYTNGNRIYKYCFDCCIKRANFIFSQGKENYSLIESIAPGKRVFYYPNCVTDGFYPHSYPVKSTDRVNLMYFGRISATKNVDIVIDAFMLLAEKHDNVYLDLVGNCPEAAYAEHIRKRINESGYSDRLKLHPACNHDQLKEHLKDKHIYLFPTTEPHEGHSNAMTEAMAWGLLPVATAQGFNRSVVAEAGVIVEDLSSDAFANAIDDLILSGKIPSLSKVAYQRVMDNYTDAIVYRKLKEEYQIIFDLVNKDND